MTLLQEGRGKIEIVYPNSTISLKALEAEVDLAVNSIFEASFKCLKDEVDYWRDQGKEIDIGNTINIYLGRGSSLTNVFSGRIKSIEEELSGHEPREISFTAEGWGSLLKYRTLTGRRRDTGSNLLSWIIEDTGITGNHIASTGRTLTFQEQEVSRWDAVEEIASKLGWLFYVDNSKDLWVFPRDQYVTSESFQHVSYSGKYVKNSDKIINVQKVVGARLKTLGSDQMYTETVSSSEHEWVGSNTPYATSDVKSPDSRVGAGSNVIRVDGSVSNPPWLELKFKENGSYKPLDLSRFGSLSFSYCYRVFTSAYLGDSMDLRIDMKTSDTDYFSSTLSLSGVQTNILGWNQPLGYFYGWNRLDFNFNLMKAPDQTVEVVGNPSYDKISSIRIQPVSPIPDQAVSLDFSVDNLYFTNGYFYGSDSDENSISKYGVREGPVIVDSSIYSDVEADELADLIVSLYKDPIEVLEDVETYGKTSFILGYRATIPIADYNLVLNVERIRHRLKGFDLRTTFDFSSVHIPTVETIIRGLSRKMEKQERSPLTVPDLGLFKLGPPLLDFSDVERVPYQMENLIYNPSFEVRDRYWAPEADVPACWIPSLDPAYGESFRDSDSVHGFKSLRITGGRKFTSWLFPVRKTSESDRDYYFYSFYAKSISGSSNVSLELILYDATGSSSTLNLESGGSSTSWQQITGFLLMPSGKVSGALRIGAPIGETKLVDDVWFSRCNYVRTPFTDYDPSQYNTSSTSPELLKSYSYPNTFNTHTYLGTVSAQFRINQLDSQTAYLKIAVYKDGLLYAQDTFSEDQGYWRDVSLTVNNTFPLGSSIDVRFYGWLNASGSECQVRSCSSSGVSGVIEVPYRK